MLTFSDQSFASLASESRDRWMETAVRTIYARHSEWCRSKQPEEIREICEQLDAISAKYDLDKHETFIMLVDLVVIDHFAYHITPFQDYLLARSGFSEVIAVSRFCDDVRRGSLIKLLSLDELSRTGEI